MSCALQAGQMEIIVWRIGYLSWPLFSLIIFTNFAASEFSPTLFEYAVIPLTVIGLGGLLTKVFSKQLSLVLLFFSAVLLLLHQAVDLSLSLTILLEHYSFIDLIMLEGKLISHYFREFGVYAGFSIVFIHWVMPTAQATIVLLLWRPQTHHSRGTR